MIHYDNTPTIVVVLVPLRGDLLMIRRALVGEGQGKPALPGGYQILGQTWQEAGAREVVEEKGVVVVPETLRLPPQATHAIEVDADAPHGFRDIRIEFKTSG